MVIPVMRGAIPVKWGTPLPARLRGAEAIAAPAGRRAVGRVPNSLPAISEASVDRCRQPKRVTFGPCEPCSPLRPLLGHVKAEMTIKYVLVVGDDLQREFRLAPLSNPPLWFRSRKGQS